MTSFPPLNEIVNDAYVNDLIDAPHRGHFPLRAERTETWDDAVAEPEKNNLAESTREQDHGWGVQPSKRGGIKETYPHETWADWGIDDCSKNNEKKPCENPDIWGVMTPPPNPTPTSPPPIAAKKRKKQALNPKHIRFSDSESDDGEESSDDRHRHRYRQCNDCSDDCSDDFSYDCSDDCSCGLCILEGRIEEFHKRKEYRQASDGDWYLAEEFLYYYGSFDEWNAAEVNMRKTKALNDRIKELVAEKASLVEELRIQDFQLEGEMKDYQKFHKERQYYMEQLGLNNIYVANLHQAHAEDCDQYENYITTLQRMVNQQAAYLREFEHSYVLEQKCAGTDEVVYAWEATSLNNAKEIAQEECIACLFMGKRNDYPDRYYFVICKVMGIPRGETATETLTKEVEYSRLITQNLITHNGSTWSNKVLWCMAD
jgi:hypothetical protein